MNEKWFLKKSVFFWLTLTFVLTSGFIGITQTRAANHSDLGLFKEYRDAFRLEASDDPTVINERFVMVNFNQLPGYAEPTEKSLVPQEQENAKQILHLNLFEGVVLNATQDRIETNELGQLVWVGHAEGALNSEVILVAKDDVLVGNITLDDLFFQVRYMGNGIHAVRWIDQSAFPNELDPIPVEDGEIIADRPSTSNEGTSSDPSEKSETDSLGFTPSAGDDGRQIEVLVVWTPSARSAAGGTTAMNALITLAQTESNSGYARSGILFRILIVHRQEVNYTERGGSSGFDAALADIKNGRVPNVFSLRTSSGADMVSFWINNNASCGLAYVMTTVSNAFKINAFSVVHYQCATGYYSFAHELGHNQGSMHDRAQTNQPGAYTYSHGYAYSNLWRTVMAYRQGSPSTRMNFWSNPNKTYNGNPTGVPSNLGNSADNRLSLNNTRVTVDNWGGGGGTPPPPPPPPGGQTQWRVRNGVACKSGAAFTFRGTIDGTSRSSTTYGPQQGGGFSSYASAAPGRKTFVYGISSGCGFKGNGRWTPTTVLAANKKFLFQLEITGYIVLYLEGDQKGQDGLRLEPIETFEIETDAKGEIQSTP